MKKIIFNRPVITILILYIFVIIILNYCGYFLPEKNSCLLQQTNLKQVELTGKVITSPIQKDDKQQFILEVYNVNNKQIKKEKTLVYLSSIYNVNYGDIICGSGKINIPQKPTFPYNFDYNLYLQQDNIYTIFYQQNFELVDEKANEIKYLSMKVRNNIENKIDKFFKKPYSSIIKSMITGNKSVINKDIKEDFINTGLIHILVISGLHIGFCTTIFMFIYRLFGLKLNYVYILTIITLFFYVLLTGATPPTLRAFIMFSCILFALMINREPLIYNALALSALIILIINPQTLFTASFQLSFLATFGIIYLYPKFSICFGIKNIYIKYAWNIICVTLSAQIALIPVLVFYFGKLSIISFILNLLIVPIIPFLIGLSFIFYFFSLISAYLATFVAFILIYLLKLILYIINYTSNLSFSVIYFAVPSIVKILFYYFAIIVMFEFKNNKKIMIVLFCVICIMFINPFEEKTFIKTFKNSKNITTHIKKSKNENIIIFKRLKKDKFYFNNLEQYLLSQGIYEITEFQTNFNEAIDNMQKFFSKITIKNVKLISNK